MWLVRFESHGQDENKAVERWEMLTAHLPILTQTGIGITKILLIQMPLTILLIDTML